MALSDILNKMSPVGNKITRDMSESEYMRLVDRNTELFDENKELHEEIERLNYIINEFDGYLDLKRKSYIEGFKWSGLEIIDQSKDFLQELKGSNK